MACSISYPVHSNQPNLTLLGKIQQQILSVCSHARLKDAVCRGTLINQDERRVTLAKINEMIHCQHEL